MAIIDVDRHLLLEITYNIKHISDSAGKIFEAFDKIAKAGSESNAVLFQTVGEWEEKKKEIKKIRKEFWTAVDKGKFESRHIGNHNAKLEALSYHLVSAIAAADTKRGRETNGT
jgi:hypothetical protein